MFFRYWLASSRRSVSWGAARKNKEKAREGKYDPSILNCELARLSCSIVLFMSLNFPFFSASELTVHPPTCCRFCQKIVKCKGTKIPGVSIFNGFFNKVSGAESFNSVGRPCQFVGA